MNRALNNLQVNLFTILLYTSGFGLIAIDLATGEGNRTALYALYDALIIFLALTSLSFVRKGMVYLLVFLFICIIANLSYSAAPMIVSLNGLREIIIIFAVCIFYNRVFVDGNEEMAERCIAIMRKFGFLFLMVQMPVVLMQYLKYGPGDYVGGTYGNLGSGTLTFSVICLFYFLHHFKRRLIYTVLLYVALIPLLMNETKISFILIPMSVLFIRFQPRLKNMIAALAAALVFLFLFDKYYTHGSLEFQDNLTGIFSPDFLQEYLLGDIYKYDDVPRFTRIILAWQIISEQTNTFLFGLEYGMFKGSALGEVTHIAETYNWLLIGTRPYVFFLMMQGGMMLVGAFIWLFAYINNFFKRSNKFKLYLAIIFFLILIYVDILRHQSFVAIYFFLVYYANSKFYTEKELTG